MTRKKGSIATTKAGLVLAGILFLACKRSPMTTDAGASTINVEAPPSPVRFRGTVLAVEPLPPHAARTAFVVDRLPRFLVTIRVESVTSGVAPWSPKSDPSFLVHSPSRTFGTSEPIRGSYDITLDPPSGTDHYTLTATAAKE
jgi:hypothetical protein